MCPGQCPSEQKTKKNVDALSLKYMSTKRAAIAKGNKKLAREADRILWAKEAVAKEKFLASPIQSILDKYTELDLVPQGYHYPELYEF